MTDSPEVLAARRKYDVASARLSNWPRHLDSHTAEFVAGITLADCHAEIESAWLEVEAALSRPPEAAPTSESEGRPAAMREIAELLTTITNNTGCSAGECQFTGTASGQHTNVNCRCHRDPTFIRCAVALYRACQRLLVAPHSPDAAPSPEYANAMAELMVQKTASSYKDGFEAGRSSPLPAREPREVSEGDIENLRHVGRSPACGPQRGGALLDLADRLERGL